jgi:DNA invertase Pin-like site-specific DNA recombinase
MPKVILYTRVSTDEQTRSGLSLEAQQAELEAEARRRGWTDTELITDAGQSAATNDRPGLHDALERLEAGQASMLVATRLDRLARSTLGFAQLMEAARKQGWAVVVLDLNLDMTTPTGKFVADIMAAVAELERAMIAARTRAALAAKKARGQRVGREPEIPEAVRRRILREHRAGRPMTAIAHDLTARGVPTARGAAAWSKNTVRRVIRAAEGK